MIIFYLNDPTRKCIDYTRLKFHIRSALRQKNPARFEIAGDIVAQQEPDALTHSEHFFITNQLICRQNRGSG